MKLKFLIFSAIPFLTTIASHAQELSSKIPAESQFVVSINNKGIIESSSLSLWSETLAKIGAIEEESNGIKMSVKELLEQDLDLNKQAYIYRTSSDSLNYTGILFPLKAGHRIQEHMFSKFNEIPSYKGYEKRVSQDGKTQVAWNGESLLILTGSLNDSYFQIQEVGDRYGLNLEAYGYDAWEYDDTLADAAEEVIWNIENEAATVDTLTTEDLEEWDWEEEEMEAESLDEWEEDYNEEEAAVAIENWEDWEAVGDSAEATDWDFDSDSSYYDEYDMETDSIYLLNQERIAKNDSIKNELFMQWFPKDFDNYLEPKNNLAKNKAIHINDNKVLVRMWIPNLDQAYQEALPYDILEVAYGVRIRDIKYGYQDATLDLIQDKHTIKLAGTVNMDQEMIRFFKELYKNKLNKDFIKYIPDNHLAYVSLNISTEGYLQQLPTLVSRWYAPMMSEEYADILSLATTALEIGLDEKAIGKVMKGDNLFFLNDLQKVSKEYIDYEYDENYDYVEVTKTKEEYVPSYLWMFTSEDQRLFKTILAYAVKKEEATHDNDIYTIAEKGNREAIHILFKKDIVFVGSDIDQIKSIQENRFKSNSQASIKKDIMKYPFNFVVHTPAIPEMIQKLEIPVTESWKKQLKSLSDYGDVQIKSNTVNNKGIYGELSLELPKKDKSALEHLLKQIMENLNNSDTN